jgi:hypothetical protein
VGEIVGGIDIGDETARWIAGLLCANSSECAQGASTLAGGATYCRFPPNPLAATFGNGLSAWEGSGVGCWTDDEVEDVPEDVVEYEAWASIFSGPGAVDRFWARSKMGGAAGATTAFCTRCTPCPSPGGTRDD